MNVSSLLSNVRRMVEDDGLRWSDDDINEYLVEGVNEIFRKTGGVTDTVPFNFVQGESEYVISGMSGRVIALRVRPKNNTATTTLQQVQVTDLPIDFSKQSDPTTYALSQVAIQGDSSVDGSTGDFVASLTEKAIN